MHPDYVLPPEEAGDVPEREPVYGLSEGLTNNRLRQLAAQALERAPELPEWIEPSVLARKGWPAWREALHAVHGDPAHAKARERLAYDELRSEEHTSELQSLMRISYAVFRLKKKKQY